MTAPKPRPVYWQLFEIIEHGKSFRASKPERLNGPELVKRLKAAPSGVYVVLTARGRPFIIQDRKRRWHFMSKGIQKAIAA